MADFYRDQYAAMRAARQQYDPRTDTYRSHMEALQRAALGSIGPPPTAPAGNESKSNLLLLLEDVK